MHEFKKCVTVSARSCGSCEGPKPKDCCPLAFWLSWRHARWWAPLRILESTSRVWLPKNSLYPSDRCSLQSEKARPLAWLAFFLSCSWRRSFSWSHTLVITKSVRKRNKLDICDLFWLLWVVLSRVKWPILQLMPSATLQQDSSSRTWTKRTCTTFSSKICQDSLRKLKIHPREKTRERPDVLCRDKGN